MNIMINITTEKFITALNDWIKLNWKGDAKELAKYLDISPQHLSNITTKKRGCGEETRLKICNKLGIDYLSLIETGKHLPSPISDKEESFLELPPKDKQNKKNNIITLNRRSTDPPPDERLQAIIDNLQKIYKGGNEQLISGIELSLNAFVKTEKTRKVKIPER